MRCYIAAMQVNKPEVFLEEVLYRNRVKVVRYEKGENNFDGSSDWIGLFVQ